MFGAPEPLFSKLFAHLSQFRLLKANETLVDANIMGQSGNLQTSERHEVHCSVTSDVIYIYRG